MSMPKNTQKVEKMLQHYKKLMRYCKGPLKPKLNSKKNDSSCSIPSVPTALKDWNTDYKLNGLSSTMNSREIILPAKKRGERSKCSLDDITKEKCRARRIRQSRKIKTLSMLN